MVASALLASFVFSSCSTGVKFPDGSRNEYISVRTVVKDPTIETTSKENEVHGRIQNALKAEFTSRGLQYGTGNSDLIVTYLVVYQDNIKTTFRDTYFGTNDNAEEISELAHKRGVIEKRIFQGKIRAAQVERHIAYS